MTNLGLIGYNKRFLYAAVGAPGSTHDARLLKESSIYSDIINGNVIPDRVVQLGDFGDNWGQCLSTICLANQGIKGISVDWFLYDRDIASKRRYSFLNFFIPQSIGLLNHASIILFSNISEKIITPTMSE